MGHQGVQGSCFWVVLPFLGWGAVCETPAAPSPPRSFQQLRGSKGFHSARASPRSTFQRVSWFQIKMSFYWRSANFKECRIYCSECWLLATCCYLSIPLSSCFRVWFGVYSPPPPASLDLSLFHLKMTDGSLPHCNCDYCFFFFHFFIVPFLKEQLQGAG